MPVKNYNVAIVYRTYPGTKPSRTRVAFQNNKYKLVELCIKSLKESLGSLKFKIWVILDSCPPEWEDLFLRYFSKDELEFVHLNKAGELGSFQIAMDILLNQTFSELVFMAEDDYFYLPKQFIKMIKFLYQNPKVDFITPYDHLDHYTHPIHDYSSEIKVAAGKYWRTVSTTCNTYITTKNVLYLTKDIFLKSYSKKNFFFKYGDIINKKKILNILFRDFIQYSSDADVWLSLTKKRLFNLFKLIKLRVQNREVFGYYFRAWRFNWKQILFGKRWSLWCPIPTIATHMDSRYLAPNIDWDQIFKKEIDKINKS